MAGRGPGFAISTVAVAVLALVGCSDDTPESPRPSDGAPTLDSPLPRPAASSTVSCPSHIDTVSAPAFDLEVVAGVVALPTASSTDRPLQLGPAQDVEGRRRFAKRGLIVRSGRSFELVVPPRARDRLAIEWGTNDTPTWRLRVSCVDPDARWLVFAGGYYATRPGCLPLVVRTDDGAEERVRIPVGESCKHDAAG